MQDLNNISKDPTVAFLNSLTNDGHALLDCSQIAILMTFTTECHFLYRWHWYWSNYVNH